MRFKLIPVLKQFKCHKLKIQIMNFLQLSFSAFLIALSAFGCGGNKSTVGEVETPRRPGIYFEQSARLSPLLERAAAENKLVFLDMYADWCAPCKVMDREVFTNVALGEFFDENFISYKVNTEDENGSTVASIYEVKSLPTLIFVDASGKVLERADQSISLSELKRMAKRALATQSVGSLD